MSLRANRDRLALFVQYTAEPSGSPISGLMVVRAMVDAGWEVDQPLGMDA